MYLPIFIEKLFNSTNAIQYVTEPFYVGGYKDYRYDIQLRELSTGTIVTVRVKQSDTGDYDQPDEWATLGNPTSLDGEGHAVFNTGQMLNWIRFIIDIDNPTGRASAKLSLTGHLTRR